MSVQPKWLSDQAHWPWFWKERYGGEELLDSPILTEEQISKHDVPDWFTWTDLYRLQEYTIECGVKYRSRLGAHYWEYCRAKVHFLYMAYRRRIERSICLHIATVISIWGSLSPVGHCCFLLTTLEKADVSETLKVPVHLGGWTVIDPPKTASTPMRRTGSGFFTSSFFLLVVLYSDGWPGDPRLSALATGGLSKTTATSWKHLCTSRSEGDCGKK